MGPGAKTTTLSPGRTFPDPAPEIPVAARSAMRPAAAKTAARMVAVDGGVRGSMPVGMTVARVDVGAMQESAIS